MLCRFFHLAPGKSYVLSLLWIWNVTRHKGCIFYEEFSINLCEIQTLKFLHQIKIFMSVLTRSTWHLRGKCHEITCNNFSMRNLTPTFYYAVLVLQNVIILLDDCLLPLELHCVYLHDPGSRGALPPPPAAAPSSDELSAPSSLWLGRLKLDSMGKWELETICYFFSFIFFCFYR